MTHAKDKNVQDRGIWEQYRRTWPKDLKQQAAIDPDGEDANQIVSFLYNRLSKREQSAFEKRMAHEPALRDAVIAAREALVGEDMAEAAAPAELTAWAKNLKPLNDPSGRSPTRMPLGTQNGSLFLKPVVGFAFGMGLLGIVAGFGIFKAIEDQVLSGPIASKSAPPKAPASTANKRGDDPDKNSIFSSDPQTILKQLDLDLD